MADRTQPVTTKPLRRSERLGAALPTRELPEREELVRLFAKYDVAAPRYTSYPPATKFTTSFDRAAYFDRLSHSGANNEVSLYVHLPFCDTLCYFCGCTMMVSNNRATIAEYLDYLKREITLMSELLDDPTVVQMHWGGGSPTHLLPEQIASLAEHLRQRFRFAEDAECSIEIDPRGLTPEHITALRQAGFNRTSIGVQDFEETVQRAVNRIQPRSMTEQVIDWLRGAGITSINLDLIYGLPYQTTSSFRETLEAACELKPSRLAVYNFAYVPWIKPHQQLIPAETLPHPTSKLALLELAIRDLTNAGYEYLGMDHFARPDDALFQAQRAGSLQRNFQGYSTLAGKDMLAFGISAIGRTENRFAQNTKTLDAYYRAVASERLPVEKGYELTPDDELHEYAIMQLMCNLQIDKPKMDRLFGISFDEYFKDALRALSSLEADGLCKLGSEEISVTQTGRFFLRNIALPFDQYAIKADDLKTPVFSRTV